MKNHLLKKVISAGLIVGLLTAGVAGCGSKDAATGSGDSQGTGDSTEKITVVAATGASPRPFSYYDDDNNLTGHNIELVNAVFEKLPQYELVWEATDFPSIFAGLDSNRYQLGVNNFASNEERKEKYLFTDPIFANAFVVVTNKNLDLPEVVTYEDLAGLTYIGEAGINHTTLVEQYNEAHPDNQINIVYTEEDLSIQLTDVESGKYDFTTIDAPMFYGYYQPEFGYNVNVSDLDGFGVDAGIYSFLLVSKGNDQLVEDINAALKEVIEEGTSKEINEKYFGGDYTPYK